MEKLAIGILAHVDAGKTTLSEGMMYLSGMLRHLGRVDHGDAFLDNFALERSRGITIFSKQAVFTFDNKEITLLDTPGHVDFSAEMERTLSVLDYAVLVISGPDGVQGHTQTLWRLLKEYKIPTFLFINKMDQEGADRDRILEELKNYLGDGFVPFDVDKDEMMAEDFQEALAMCDEDALEHYLEGNLLIDEDIVRLIKKRKVFPCWFGSALKLMGVEEFLTGLTKFTRTPHYPNSFGAKVYKISRDDQGNRLTHLKITGGSMKVKMALGDEKIDQIRIYSGPKFNLADTVYAGTICAVTGLNTTSAGQGLGQEKDAAMPILTPILSCQLILPEGVDPVKALRSFRELEEEEPQLHIMWNPQLSEIQVQLMGEVQTEILTSMIEDRYHMKVEFGKEHIMYRETIQGEAAGVGHYEPLRHYAEVHLRLSGGELGSGLVFDSECSIDRLDRNWQRLILTHLYEKEHIGVLTGSPITDMKITITDGRAHLKHTEGGDFRQSTYRAVRQGLMEAKRKGQCVLLEPWFAFHIELPADMIGRAMADVTRMSGSCDGPEIIGESAILTGKAPASEMIDYQKELWAYTGGRGRLTLKLSGYEPCHNTEEVIEEYAYNPDADTDNPSGSIFCAHGAGFFVPWDQVPDHMHLKGEKISNTEMSDTDTPDRDGTCKNTAGRDSSDKDSSDKNTADRDSSDKESSNNKKETGAENHTYQSFSIEEEKELDEIFEKAYGKKERKQPAYKSSSTTITFGEDSTPEKEKSKKRGTADKKGTADHRGTDDNRGAADKKDTSSKKDTGSNKESVYRKNITSKKDKKKDEKEYLLVDGYNIIFAWEDLNDLAESNMEAARSKLADILCNYQGYVGCEVILVFDAYKVKGNQREVYRYHNIHIVFTKEAETADQYIEKTTHELGRKYHVRVATSDALEQVIVMGQGATRISARDFKEEVDIVTEAIRKLNAEGKKTGKNYLFDYMDQELAEEMEQVRLGEKEFKNDEGDQNHGTGN